MLSKIIKTKVLFWFRFCKIALAWPSLSWTSILGGGQFRTLLFPGFWHMGKLGGGKKYETPCTCTFRDKYQHHIKYFSLRTLKVARVES